jgi:uncharacterized protein involved in outer membrane biogenesis
MAMSVRRRIGWAAAAIFGPLAVAALAAPYLVDVEAYKPALIQAVKEATGRELVIEGPMRLSLLPVPRVSAQQVHFANAVGAEGAQMIDVRWIGASPSWWALLKGQVEVGRLTLYQPTIVLETDANGVPNWQFKPGAGAAQLQGAPSAGLHLAVGKLRIVQGTLSYTNPQTRQTLKAEQIEATASVGSLQGPLSMAGTATVNGVPLSLDFSLGEPKPEGHEAAFSLQVSSGRLDFKGTVSELGANADVKGHLAVSTGVLTNFIATVVRATGQAEPKFDAPVVGTFTFDGGVEYSPTRLAVTDFKMSLAGETASGTLALEGTKTLSLRGHVTLPKVDVEKWLALLATPGAFQPPPPASKPATAAKPGSLSPFPVETDVSLSLDIAEVLYRKGTVRDLALAVEIHKGVITVPQVKAVLPGGMVLQAHAAAAAAPATAPAKPAMPTAKPAANPVQASGEIALAGPKLRDTLAWLDIDTSGVPADKLQTLDLKGTLASTASGLQIGDLLVDLDGQRAAGSGVVTFASPVTATAILQFDRLDLDAYLPAEPAAPIAPTAGAATAATDAPKAPASTPATIVPPAPPLPDKTVPVFGLKTKVAKLVFRKQTLSGVEADASVQGNLLKLNSVKVADLLGAKIDLQGSMADFATAPRYDLTFNATMPDADKVIDYAGLPKFINGKIGALSAGGGVVGTMDAIALRNATVTLLGSTLRATGALSLGQNFRFDFPSFALQAQDASRLLAVATGQGQNGIGAISAAGAFKGDEQRVSFDGDLTAVGTAMSGHIDATLGKRPNITANLRVPGTLDFDQWLGVSASPPSAAPAPAAATATPAAGAPAAAPVLPVPVGPPRAATGKAIDLAALRAFDATLNLETSAIAIASLKVTYADMQAGLHNGVFKIAKLTGQFYGGAVDFSGTIDASKDALALGLKGSLQGIYLSEMLRGTAGTNNFGNQHLMVSVDGKITVMNIELKGSGTTPEQIRNTLSGSGQVSGYLYPAVAGGSLGFASFATGLGSVFSTEMGFNSAVLAGFINHQSPITGELLLSGNTVTLQNHKVQGQNAIALITSRTSLTQAITDTTIALDTGRRGPADYVMTVKGPISSPTMSTRGGGN